MSNAKQATIKNEEYMLTVKFDTTTFRLLAWRDNHYTTE